MAPLAALLLRLLPTAALLSFATSSLAATKLDLSPYLAVTSLPGDFKVFVRSTGGERRVTVTDLAPWPKGWKQVTETVVSGAGPDFDGTVISEDFLIPGKQLLSGTELYSNGFRFFFKKPAKSLKLLGAPGKPQRIKQKGLLLLNGRGVGTIERRMSWTIEGFETVVTPSGSYPDALRAKAFAGLRLRGGGGELIELDEVTSWYAPGLGLVRMDVLAELWENGSLAAEEAWSETLGSGSVDGVPFP